MSHVSWSVCLCVCVLGIRVSCAKTGEPIEMPFWGLTRVGRRNHGAQIPAEMGHSKWWQKAMRPFVKLLWILDYSCCCCCIGCCRYCKWEKHADRQRWLLEVEYRRWCCRDTDHIVVGLAKDSRRTAYDLHSRPWRFHKETGKGRWARPGRDRLARTENIGRSTVHNNQSTLSSSLCTRTYIARNFYLAGPKHVKYLFHHNSSSSTKSQVTGGTGYLRLFIGLCRYYLQQLTNTRGHSYKLAKSLCSHDIYKYFFTNRTVDLWNSLPNDVVSVQSQHIFKYKVSRLII